MKAVYHILTAAAIAGIGSGCRDFLEEQNPNKIPSETFYSTEQDITYAATGAYVALRGAGYYRDWYLTSDIRSNQTTVMDPGAANGTNWEFYNYTLKTDNSKLKAHWTDLYKCIQRANIVLDHLDAIPFADEAKKSALKAEMLFLRALTYFNIVAEFGDAPLVLKELKTKDEIVAHTKRDPKAEIWKQVKKDLTDVINSSLPNHQQGANIGRASKAAAYGILGKALLHKASDKDFEAERSANLNEAKAALEQCWSLKQFASLSAVPYEDIFDKTKQITCPEILFQVMYQGGSESLRSIYAYTFQPTGEPGLTSQRNGGGVNIPTPATVNEYEAGDLRKSISVAVSPKNQNYTKKYTDLDDINGYGANNWIVLRYADVALLLAEVKMHLNEGDAEQYINMVRSRAGLGSTTITNLRDAILHERFVELAFEGHSWLDMLRLYTKEELLALKSAQNPNFMRKDFLFPIPYDEYKLNPDGMYQNEGYQ